MPVILKNNVSSTLAIAITASDTGIVVADGSRFPAPAGGDYFYATLVSSAGVVEVVKVTARVGNSLAVVRAQDGSSAASFQVGSLVEMRTNAASVQDAVEQTVVQLEAAFAAAVTDQRTTLDVAELLADTTFTYTPSTDDTVVAGDIIRTQAEGFAYEVAASGATNHHVVTAGGVKLYVLVGASGYDVRAFGAVGDGVTDDTAAINLALACVRSFEDSPTLLRPAFISGAGKRFRVNGSLDATLIRLGKGWGIRDMWIIGRAAGKTILDLTASRFGYFNNLHIWGGNALDAANDPHTGILVACADPATTFPCDSHTWVNCSVDGYFAKSAYTEYGSEVTSHTGCIFWNRRVESVGNPAWAAVLQGRDTQPMVSDFQTISTGRVSYTVKQYDLCRFQKPFGIAGPTVYIEDLASTRFSKPYMTNGSGAVVTWDLNSDFVPYDVQFDGLQIETTGTDKAFLFTSATASTFSLYDFGVSFGNIFTDTAVFDASGPAKVVLSKLKLFIPRWQSGKPTNVFANANLFEVAGGEISLPAATDMESFSAFAAGTNYKLYGHGGVWRSYGVERFSSGIPLVADGGVNTGKGETLADDAVVSIDLNALGHGTTGKLDFWSTASGVAGTIFFRADASPAILVSTVGTGVDTTTGATLTGTTGVDGRFTVAINDGQIQFENRRGFVVTYRYFITGFDSGS